jgi:bacillithiol system protein YtxJ
MEPLQRIEDERDVDALFRADLAILYKHSPTCGVCTAALSEVEAFLGRHPDAVVYVVNVLAQRELSQRIAARSDVRHESPQVIIVQRGTSRWAESHYGITVDTLTEQFHLARREDEHGR